MNEAHDRSRRARGLGGFNSNSDQSDRANVLRLLAFPTLPDVELDGLTLLEGSVPVHLDLGVVNEHVLGAFARDEAEALLGVEEFHCSSCQLTVFLLL
jgi:hypothetical protein